MSLIPGDPVAQSLVQQNMLQREFQDGLLPSFLYRAEVAASEEWTGQAGDTKTFTGTGFMDIDTTPKDPRVDPTPKEYPFEQWSATLNDWKDTADVQMTQSYNSIQSLYLEKAKKLGINAGATLNRIIRQRLFNPAQAGWTVANTAQSATTTLRVERLNGFTTARRPDLPAGSPVRYDPVSAANPLQITIQTSATTTVTRNVTGFVSDFFILGAPDEFGPGTLTLDAAVTVADRAAVIASNATWLWRAAPATTRSSARSTRSPRRTCCGSTTSRRRWRTSTSRTCSRTPMGSSTCTSARSASDSCSAMWPSSAWRPRGASTTTRTCGT